MNTRDPLLVARSLTKNYRSVVALDSADFSIGAGITGLLGENGAGKSTAIKIFLGLVKPTDGRAEVFGRDASLDIEVRARLGYMPEHDCLPSSVIASEFLTHMAESSGLPRKQARSRAADILRHVGLFEERYRPIGDYSTGMKQRVKLAQCLVHDPSLALLDEPTAGLDPSGREDMLELVRKTYNDFGISIVLSTHLMNDVERTADRIVVLREGRVVEEGEVASFTTEKSETVYIEVNDRRDELASSLSAQGVSTRMDGSSIVALDVGEEEFDRIRDALAASGASLRRMGPRRRSLIEVFEDGGGKASEASSRELSAESAGGGA